MGYLLLQLATVHNLLIANKLNGVLRANRAARGDGNRPVRAPTAPASKLAFEEALGQLEDSGDLENFVLFRLWF